MRSTLAIALIAAATAIAQPQNPNRPSISRTHPAIRYGADDSEVHDAVDNLNRRLLAGTSRLDFDATNGYLHAVLDALHVPVESQILVFSKTSLQSFMIDPDNPRAIFFNDSVAVAFVRGAPVLEVTAQDPRQGAIFYTIAQDRQNRPVLARETVCLSCHLNDDTLGTPGLIVRSVFPGKTGDVLAGMTGAATDHHTPFDMRWGGWYVSGKSGPLRHLANAIVDTVHADGGAPGPIGNREPLPTKFSATGYPTPHSDVVALTVFEHQVQMMNWITRIGWEARVGLYCPELSHSCPNYEYPNAPPAVESQLRETAKDLVDYLFFIDEARFTAPIEGSSGFAEKFTAQGPFDKKGRSLRQLDLSNRLLRYPCSYMIYSDAFRALPSIAKGAIYRRMWQILSGAEQAPRYGRLSATDRQAIIEILRDTLDDLPDFESMRK
jgi:hypothetical protein